MIQTRRKSISDSPEARPRGVLVVLGPTATGKSDLAVWLAKKFKGLPRQRRGEIISADSRQVYRGMDIGTGKITKREMSDVKHHLLDVCSPKKVFTVADYQRMAGQAVTKIIGRGNLPIICGGTGLYIQSIVDGPEIPNVPPNARLRRELGAKSAGELFKILRRLDPRRARNIDRHNPVRLVRAIEIAKALGAVPKLKLNKNKNYEFLQIGLKLDRNELKEKIQKRLLKRLRSSSRHGRGGMIAEVKRLRRSGVSWRRLHDFGLEYRFVAAYLQGELTKQEMINKLATAINQYAKRQMTWFKRDKRIHWFKPEDRRGIEELTKIFLSR